MAAIVVEDFVYPAVLPTFARWTPSVDPVVADDHFSLWKILLAIEKNVGVYPNGHWSTLERRIRNANRINSQIVTRSATDWGNGAVAVTWAADAGGGNQVTPLFDDPPIVLANLRKVPASGDPFKFYAYGVSETGATIRARATGGGVPSGATTFSVSVIAIGYAAPGG